MTGCFPLRVLEQAGTLLIMGASVAKRAMLFQRVATEVRSDETVTIRGHCGLLSFSSNQQTN